MYYHGEKANQMILGEILVKKTLQWYLNITDLVGGQEINNNKKQQQRNILYDCVE